jgi:hypothetical protein
MMLKENVRVFLQTKVVKKKDLLSCFLLNWFYYIGTQYILPIPTGKTDKAMPICTIFNGHIGFVYICTHNVKSKYRYDNGKNRYIHL